MTHLFEYIISGGLFSLLLALLTLRSQVRKAQAETKAIELQNSDAATEILIQNIVEPLKKELHETRQELSLLRAAIHEATYCRYALDCPVIIRMQKSPDGGGFPGVVVGGAAEYAEGQHGNRAPRGQPPGAAVPGDA